MSYAIEPGTGRRADDLTPALVDYYRGEGWTIEDVEAPVTFPQTFVDGVLVETPPAPVEADLGEWDPSAYTVDQVNEYLAGVDEQARDRVFELERAGKARVGILDGPYAVFEPSEHTVDEVNGYLDGVDDEVERERVLAAERDGQARVGILGD